jgi:hypothetical protein
VTSFRRSLIPNRDYTVYTPSVTSLAELVDAVHQHAAPDAADWLDVQLTSISRTSFAPAFAAAGRKLGATADAGRGALVLALIATLEGAEHVAFVRDLIRRGDNHERQAVLRVLAALPDPARFVELAIDACRTNVQSVFEAIACDNAYPARHFPEPAFNQMVLKALFIGAPVARIVDLQARVTDELVRMVEAYASERRAAGRAIPDDAKLVRKS